MKNLVLILILVIFAQIALASKSKGRNTNFLRSQCKSNGSRCKHDSDCCSFICVFPSKTWAKHVSKCRSGN